MVEARREKSVPRGMGMPWLVPTLSTSRMLEAAFLRCIFDHTLLARLEAKVALFHLLQGRLKGEDVLRAAKLALR